MFENLLSLKMYRSDMQSINELVEIKTLKEFYEGDYEINILPVFDYYDKSYTAGDLFFNKRTKSMFIFSFITNPYHHGIQKVGFFRIKDFLEFEKIAKITDKEFTFLTDNFESELNLDFIKLNECSNINKFTKIGNIILNQEFMIDELTELYEEWHSTVESNVKKVSLFIKSFNILEILIKKNDMFYNSIEYNTYHSDFLSAHVIFEENFKFYPKLWVKSPNNKRNIFSYHNQINLLKKEYQNVNTDINERYIVYFDKKKCESVISVGIDKLSINYRFIANSTEGIVYYEELREEDDDKNKYLNQVFYFLE